MEILLIIYAISFVVLLGFGIYEYIEYNKGDLWFIVLILLMVSLPLYNTVIALTILSEYI